MSLVDLVVEVHDGLTLAGIPHAFGGALALAYVAEPRGTVDVDVNVFLPPDEAATVLAALGAIGLQPEQDTEEWMPMAGIRVRRDADPYPVDVFLAVDDLYDEIGRRSVCHPFGPDRRLLPFLSAEDLALFKLSFGRDKDWVDLRMMTEARPELDVAYIERQLLGLRGPAMHRRLARLRALLAASAGGPFPLRG